MGQPLSLDLRSRLLAAIDEGIGCRAAAARFGVACDSACNIDPGFGVIGVQD